MVLSDVSDWHTEVMVMSRIYTLCWDEFNQYVYISFTSVLSWLSWEPKGSKVTVLPPSSGKIKVLVEVILNPFKDVKKNMKVLFCPVLSNIQNSSALFQHSQASSTCLSGNSFKMIMITEHWWNDTDRKNQSTQTKMCDFVHHIAWAAKGSNPGLRGGFTD